MTLAELTGNFALPGLLAFDLHGELIRAQITLPACSATVYLHGAHLTRWQPLAPASGGSGPEHAPAIFLSPHSNFTAGKAIRGGIPICFPWFGDRSDGQPGPSHGFARLQQWSLAFAAMADNALHLTFTLGPSELSRSLGFDHFRVAYEITVGRNHGRTLNLRLSVANLGPAPLRFEEALHTYFQVGNVHQASVSGLESAPYLDKTDAQRRKFAPDGPLQLSGTTDRVFPGNTASASIDDEQNQRRILLSKANSATTVVWNPWAEGSATLPDLGPDSWQHFLCVETANTGVNAITLMPKATHSMQAEITVGPA